MKNIISIIFLLFYLQHFGQINNGVVNYKAICYKSKIKKTDNLTPAEIFISNAEKSYSDFEFKLIFDKRLSTFEIIPIMLDDNNFTREKSMALFGIMKTNSLMFNNLDEGILYFQDFDEKNFYQTKEITALDWKVADETKIIDGKTCLKATTIKTVNNPVGKFNHKVIAWFCPEIPIPFGPRNYCGLPGLILELEEQGIRYYATKIDLNSKVDFTRPKIDKTITVEEFEERMNYNYKKN